MPCNFVKLYNKFSPKTSKSSVLQSSVDESSNTGLLTVLVFQSSSSSSSIMGPLPPHPSQKSPSLSDNTSCQQKRLHEGSPPVAGMSAGSGMSASMPGMSVMPGPPLLIPGEKRLRGEFKVLKLSFDRQ